MAEQMTEEDLKKMSPEEIMELQKKNCIFCQIISGKIPAKIVYQDEIVIAFLDIYPSNPGHTLIVPKEHYAIMPQIPDDVIGHIFSVCRKISQAMLSAFGVEGTNIFVANGQIAGQKAPHFMAHVMPRYSNDSVSIFRFSRKNPSAEKLNEIHKMLTAKISQMFALPPEKLIDDRGDVVPQPSEEVLKKGLKKELAQKPEQNGLESSQSEPVEQPIQQKETIGTETPDKTPAHIQISTPLGQDTNAILDVLSGKPDMLITHLGVDNESVQFEPEREEAGKNISKEIETEKEIAERSTEGLAEPDEEEKPEVEIHEESPDKELPEPERRDKGLGLDGSKEDNEPDEAPSPVEKHSKKKVDLDDISRLFG